MTIDLVNPATWGVGDKLTSPQVNALDANTASALDKRSGETDDLESDVTVLTGGSITFASGSTCSVGSGATCTVASGGLLTVASGGTLAVAAGAVFTVAAAGQIAYASPIAKSVLVPCGTATGVSTDGLGVVQPVDTVSAAGTYFGPIGIANAARGAFGLVPLAAYSAGALQYGWCVPLDAFLIHAATVASADLLFNPTAVPAHAGVPALQPAWGIFRTPIAGAANAVVNAPLKSTTNGFVRLAAGSVGAYEADQTLAFTPNQNNVIDLTTYTYTAIILDEGNTNAVGYTRYAAIRLNLTVPTVN